MLNNPPSRRCLVLSLHTGINKKITDTCRKLHFIPDFTDNQKDALNCFLQNRQFLIIIDAQLLPRFPYRLMQLFKIAHRQPAVLILNDSKRSLAGFERLEGCCIRVVNPPFSFQSINDAICEADVIMKEMVRAVYIKNLVVQAGIAATLFLAVVVALIRYLS